MPEHSSHRKASADKELQAFYLRLLTGMKRSGMRDGSDLQDSGLYVGSGGLGMPCTEFLSRPLDLSTALSLE